MHSRLCITIAVDRTHTCTKHFHVMMGVFILFYYYFFSTPPSVWIIFLSFIYLFIFFLYTVSRRFSGFFFLFCFVFNVYFLFFYRYARDLRYITASNGNIMRARMSLVVVRHRIYVKPSGYDLRRRYYNIIYTVYIYIRYILLLLFYSHDDPRIRRHRQSLYHTSHTTSHPLNITTPRNFTLLNRYAYPRALVVYIFQAIRLCPPCTFNNNNNV